MGKGRKENMRKKKKRKKKGVGKGFMFKAYLKRRILQELYINNINKLFKY